MNILYLNIAFVAQNGIQKPTEFLENEIKILPERLYRPAFIT